MGAAGWPEFGPSKVEMPAADEPVIRSRDYDALSHQKVNHCRGLTFSLFGVRWPWPRRAIGTGLHRGSGGRPRSAWTDRCFMTDRPGRLAHRFGHDCLPRNQNARMEEAVIGERVGIPPVLQSCRYRRMVLQAWLCQRNSIRPANRMVPYSGRMSEKVGNEKLGDAAIPV